MTDQLGVLYHWAPAARHDEIRRLGLQPYSPPCIGGVEPHEWANGCGHVCLGTSPSAAWQLSGALDYEHLTEIEEWDLWEVRLGERDEVRVRSEFGPRVWEVKVYNAIPPDRVWWAATRG